MENTAAARMGRNFIPKTARQRRQRNNRSFHLPTAAIRQVIISSRWISLGLLAATVYALVLIGMDENFYLKVIPVEGATAVPAQEIVAASNLAGAHVFGVDPELAAESITAVPGILTSTVTIRWPNEVKIQVGEEKPVAIWQENETQYWITRNGRLVPSRVGGHDLLVIKSELPPTYSQNKAASEEDVEAPTMESEPEPELAFIPGIVLDGALMLQQLRPNITQLYYQPSGGLSYQDGRGWRAYFGVGSDMEQKLVVYEAIVNDLANRGLAPEYISVSNQNKPYYKAQ